MAELISALIPQSAIPSGGKVIDDTFRFAVLPPRTILSLRLSAKALKKAADIRIAGRSLPQTVNSWSGDDPVICRVGPDTWLLISSLHEAVELEDAIRTGCKGSSCAVTDVSDANVTLTLEGPRAAAVLARGCGLDLSTKAFITNACSRTRLAQLPVLLRRTTHERFELVVDRAVARFVFNWVLDAAA